MPMRSAEEIKQLIITKAASDERIRAVLLNGSRANSRVKPDKYQDFDIVYLVTEMESFIADHSWVDYFGERIIWQLPGEMCFGNSGEEIGFTYLVLFTDGNRIDVTLYPLNKLREHFKPSSLTVVWLDKDNLFTHLPAPDDSDYWVKPPGQKLFADTCNEFWWVSTYVAKGLARNEITYARQMMETVVRPMFMQVTQWYVGVLTNFSVSAGTGGKFMHRHLPPATYERILQTYAGNEISNNWKALFTMAALFGEFARVVAGNLQYEYNTGEEQNVLAYLDKLYSEQGVI
ncbi:MAG TPA: aminoglycoside 6-adenylyltransferase [Chitinophagaceae bacterium]|nr:aminoglycoside 6-adenylyltransferase [Chitinophagaceae bacterium]